MKTTSQINQQLIREAEDISASHYLLWNRYVKEELPTQVTQFEPSEVDDPLSLLQHLMTDFHLWRNQLEDAASGHDPANGCDGTEAIRILEECRTYA